MRARTIKTGSQFMLVAASLVLGVTACIAEPVDNGDVEDVASVSQPLHSCTVKYGDGSYVCLTADSLQIAVCDMDSDGHYAYARIIRNNVIQNPVYDANGSASGCSYTPADWATLESYNICVQTEGCGTPKEW